MYLLYHEVIITCLHSIGGFLWDTVQIRTCLIYSIFCLQVSRNQTFAPCQTITAGRLLCFQLISHFPNKFAFNQITQTDRHVANRGPSGPSGTNSLGTKSIRVHPMQYRCTSSELKWQQPILTYLYVKYFSLWYIIAHCGNKENTIVLWWSLVYGKNKMVSLCIEFLFSVFGVLLSQFLRIRLCFCKP